MVQTPKIRETQWFLGRVHELSIIFSLSDDIQSSN